MHGFTVYACGRQVFVNMYLHAMRLHELGMQYRTERKCTLYFVYMLHGMPHYAPTRVMIPIPMILGILIEATDQLPFCQAKWLLSQSILC